MAAKPWTIMSVPFNDGMDAYWFAYNRETGQSLEFANYETACEVVLQLNR